MKRVSILLTMITLSVGIAYAGGNTTRQNFDEMYRAGTLVVNTTTKTGTTSFTTYTYSGTNAKFYSDLTDTGGKICLYMVGANAKVVTTKVEALDSLTIHYIASAARNMTVSISADSASWSAQTAVQEAPGTKTYKLPSAGDYFLKIERLASNDFYLEQVDYTTAPPCHCLRVVVSE